MFTVQADAQRRGGRCVSNTYVGSLQLMDWECADGHRWRATAHSVRQGHWCKRCADARLRFPSDLAAGLAAARGGACLSAYRNSATRMEWRCEAGHEWRATLTAVKQGRWCPTCSGRAPKRSPPRLAWMAVIQPRSDSEERGQLAEVATLER